MFVLNYLGFRFTYGVRLTTTRMCIVVIVLMSNLQIRCFGIHILFFYIICYIRCIVNLTCRNKARILSSFFGSNRFKSYRFVCVVEDCNRFPLIGLTMSLAWEKSLPIIDVFQSIITCSFLEPRILDVYDTVFAFRASFHKVCSVSDLHELTTLSFYVDKLWSARAAYSRGTLRLKPSRASMD